MLHVANKSHQSTPVCMLAAFCFVTVHHVPASLDDHPGTPVQVSAQSTDVYNDLLALDLCVVYPVFRLQYSL